MISLALIDGFGTGIGVAWFLDWALRRQNEVVFYRLMNKRRILDFFKYLGSKYFLKLFGRYGTAMFFFNEDMALMGARLSGKLAVRYGTLGLGLTFLGAGNMTYLLMLLLVLVELLFAIRKNRHVIHDLETFGRVLLEVFVTFSIVGLITEIF